MTPSRNEMDLEDIGPDISSRSHRRKNAATGASAAGVRALSTQMVAFYFRAPVKAFFRNRVEYGVSRRFILSLSLTSV
jgi:hypothetical protein